MVPFFAAVGRATNLFSKFFHCFHPHLPVFGPEYDGQVGVLLATFIAVVALDVLGLALFNVNAVSVEPVVAVLTTSANDKLITYNDTRKKSSYLSTLPYIINRLTSLERQMQ